MVYSLFNGFESEVFEQEYIVLQATAPKQREREQDQAVEMVQVWTESLVRNSVD